MEPTLEKKSFDNGFAKASKVLGILSLVSIIILPVYLPLICGGVAIILALLSRGDKEMDSNGWTGLSTGIVAIAVNIILVFAAIYIFMNNQFVRNAINAQYRELYGVSFTEMIEQSVGGDFDLDKYTTP